MTEELIVDEMERPNLNAVHLAGEIGTVETVGKQQQGLKFTVLSLRIIVHGRWKRVKNEGLTHRCGGACS